MSGYAGYHLLQLEIVSIGGLEIFFMIYSWHSLFSVSKSALSSCLQITNSIKCKFICRLEFLRRITAHVLYHSYTGSYGEVYRAEWHGTVSF